MNGLMQLLRDEEVQNLKKQYHKVTGEWLGFHWDCFGSIDEYKDYMRKIIKEHETTSQ